MNTPENKAKFFAQYWGQKVLSVTCLGVERYNTYVNAQHIHYFEYNDSYLLLTPLSSITDEDAIEVCRIRDKNIQEVLKILREPRGILIEYRWTPENKKFAISDGYCYSSTGFSFFSDNLHIDQVDFVRSKGHTYRFMGISVEDQIKFGWVKLKES